MPFGNIKKIKIYTDEGIIETKDIFHFRTEVVNEPIRVDYMSPTKHAHFVPGPQRFNMALEFANIKFKEKSGEEHIMNAEDFFILKRKLDI